MLNSQTPMEHTIHDQVTGSIASQSHTNISPQVSLYMGCAEAVHNVKQLLGMAGRTKDLDSRPTGTSLWSDHAFEILENFCGPGSLITSGAFQQNLR